MNAGKPNKAGLYFARSESKRNWFDWVVLVEGVEPFLRIGAVLTRSGIDGPYLAHRPGMVDEDCWGPKIEVPDAPEIKNKTR